MLKNGRVSSNQNDRLENPPDSNKKPTTINKTPIPFSILPKCLLRGEKKLNDFAKKTPKKRNTKHKHNKENNIKYHMRPY